MRGKLDSNQNKQIAINSSRLSRTMTFVSCLVVWILLVTSVMPYDPGYPECKLSTRGETYRGYINITISGQICQPWNTLLHKLNICNSGDGNTQWNSHCTGQDKNSQCAEIDVDRHDHYRGDDGSDTNSHGENKSQRIGDNKDIRSGSTQKEEKSQACWNGDSLTENYCRNPDGKEVGPWCYVDTDATVAEHCHVCFCKPSASCLTTPTGEEYVGTLSSTKSGLPCQRWDDTGPHTNQYTHDADFPDGSVTMADSHCRNPRGDRAGPWCYTLDPTVEWQYCDIKLCLACRMSNIGSDYAGTKSHTKSGHTCRPWVKDATLDPDLFPDRDLLTAANYCRNPDGRDGGPWCYTTDSAVTWESCDIHLCQKDLLHHHVKHVIHIGIDGLHRCTNTTTHHITSRLGNTGASTSQARTLMNTLTAPCWSGILCSLTAESSGILDNNWLPPWRGNKVKITPTTGNNVPFPCIFDVLQHHDKNTRTAAFHSWWWFNFLLDRTFPKNPDPELVCVPKNIVFNGSDFEHYGECDKKIAAKSVEYLRNILPSSQSSYTFMYFANSDTVGHMHGWCGSEYLREVQVIDGYVGQILDIVDALGMQEDVLVVMSTDHGGKGKIHWNYEDSDFLVPLFFRGPGIKTNYTMLNGARNIDIAPTILYAMGLNANPFWDGRILQDIFSD